MIISCPRCESSFNVGDDALGTTGRRVKCSKCSHLWHALPDTPPEEVPPVEEAVPIAGDGQDAGLSNEADSGADTVLSGENTGMEADPAALAGDGDAAPKSEESDDSEDTPIPVFGPDEARSDAADGTDGDGFPPPPGMLKEDFEDDPLPHKPASRRRGGAVMAVSLVALVMLIAGAGVAGFVLQSKIVMWFPASGKLYAMVGLKPDVLGIGLRIVEPKPTKRLEGGDEILVIEGQVRNKSDKLIAVPLMRGALLDENGKELSVWTFRAGKTDALPGETVVYKTEFRNPPAAAERLDITFTRSGASDLAEQPAATAKPESK